MRQQHSQTVCPYLYLNLLVFVTRFKQWFHRQGDSERFNLSALLILFLVESQLEVFVLSS